MRGVDWLMVGKLDLDWNSGRTLVDQGNLGSKIVANEVTSASSVND